MTKYDNAEEIILAAARMKMALNSHKGDIAQLTFTQAVELAKKELDELSAAAGEEEWERILVEAGDVLNFLLAIVHNAAAKYRGRERHEHTRPGGS